jgi:hypothetical protein
MAPDWDDIRGPSGSEQAQLDSLLNASDSLGASLTLDRVEAVLGRRDAVFRARLSAQRAILKRARQVLSEASTDHQEEYLAQLSEAFRTVSTERDVHRTRSRRIRAVSPRATHTTNSHPPEMRTHPDTDGPEGGAKHLQTREEYLHLALDAFQATHRAYIWRRSLWSLRRYILFVLWILAVILVAFFLTPQTATPWLLLLVVIPGAIWLLASTVLARPIERALIEQRRSYLRAWMMQLFTAQIRSESDVVLALHGLGPPGSRDGA